MTDEQRAGAAEVHDVHVFEEIADLCKALAAPMRWQILSACLESGRTNKELADVLGVNPGSVLHHVRTLVAAGLLAPEGERRGARNAVEIPYKTTDLVWRVGRSTAHLGDVLLAPHQTLGEGANPSEPA
ncbi:MAG: winged helix-turn-helix domain-containing protein [Propionibacteriaceae bacterium]|nr:winged helix-turn-helix domain-containing protein [Propionibacteriaceae bacterium]